MRRMCLVMLVCVSFVEAASAQSYIDRSNGLTLEQAMEGAVTNEPAIRAVRLGVDAARGRQAQAGLRTNPSVSFMQQEQPGGTDAQTRVDVEWPLDLYRRRARIGVATTQLAATEADVAMRERELRGLVREKYADVALAIRELSVHEDLLATAKQQESLVAARAAEGAAPEIDRRVMQAETQQLQAEQIALVGRVERELLALKRLLGLPPQTPLRLRATLDDLAASEPVDVPQNAQDSRADIVAARAQVVVKSAELSRARADAKPEISIAGMYMRMDAGFPQRGIGETGALQPVRGLFHYAAAGVTVSVPFFNRNQGEIAAIRAEERAAEQNLDASRLLVATEMASARLRVDRAAASAAAYAQSRALSRENMRIIEESYQLGRATLTDVLAQRRRVLDAEQSYTAALGERFAAQQELRHAAGDER